jgi:hypothetical protein
VAGLTQEDDMLEASMELLAEGLLTQLPASLLTAAATALCAWTIGRRRKSRD